MNYVFIRRPSFVNLCVRLPPLNPFRTPFDFCRLFSNKTSESVSSESSLNVLLLTAKRRNVDRWSPTFIYGPVQALLLTRGNLIVLRVQQRILLWSFRSRRARRDRLRWFYFAVATGVRQSPANTADHEKHEEDEDDDVKNRPITIGLGDSPVEEDVRHPKGITNAGSCFRITPSMPRAVVLTHNRPNFTYG